MIETLCFSNNLYVEHMIGASLLRESLMYCEKIINFRVKLALIERSISIKNRYQEKLIMK